MMKRIKTKWVVGLAVAAAALAGYAFLALYGLPYEDRKYSPNKVYYYELTRSYGFTDLIPRMSMPGSGGSDWMYYVDGYVRVYRTDSGDRVAKRFVEGMPMAQFNWFEDALLFFGGEGADFIELPSAAE